MGSKNSAPPPPDYTPLTNAALAQSAAASKMGEQSLAWAKEQYGRDSAVSQRVIDAALTRQATNDAAAAADRARYERTYQPLENQLISDATSMGSAERQRFEIGKAQSNVAQQFEASRRAATQNLESYGVDPSSTRFAALDAGSRIAQAAAEAAAGNQAQAQTEAQGRALRSEAINIGRGYPGQVAQSYGTALQSGNAGLNSALATTASGANTMGTNTQYMGIGSGAIGQAGNLMNQGYQNQMSQYTANQQSSSGLGTLAGGLLGAAGAAGGFAPLFAGFAEGGTVTNGGNVPHAASPSNGKAIDDVPARLTAGEFVVPKDVLSWKGEEFFQNLIKKSRDAKPQAPAQPKYAIAPNEAPTFASRPSGALPTG